MQPSQGELLLSSDILGGSLRTQGGMRHMEEPSPRGILIHASGTVHECPLNVYAVKVGGGDLYGDEQRVLLLKGRNRGGSGRGGEPLHSGRPSSGCREVPLT